MFLFVSRFFFVKNIPGVVFGCVIGLSDLWMMRGWFFVKSLKCVLVDVFVIKFVWLIYVFDYCIGLILCFL